MQAGRIRVFGHDIQREPGEALRCMGVVFQPRTLDLDLSVTQNLLYHAALHGIDRHEARMRSTKPCPGWALPTGLAAKYAISQADKCDDLKLRGHLCIGHVFYCSMRLRSDWMSRREPNSRPCAGACPRARYRRAMGHAPFRRDHTERRPRHTAPGPILAKGNVALYRCESKDA